MTRITNKSLLAKTRNWTLARLMGMNFSSMGQGALTPHESEILAKMEVLKKQLLSTWDGNSATLGLNIKSHKCTICGKRSNKIYTIIYYDGKEIVVCKKHHDSHNQENENNT